MLFLWKRTRNTSALFVVLQKTSIFWTDLENWLHSTKMLGQNKTINKLDAIGLNTTIGNSYIGFCKLDISSTRSQSRKQHLGYLPFYRSYNIMPILKKKFKTKTLTISGISQDFPNVSKTATNDKKSCSKSRNDPKAWFPYNRNRRKSAQDSVPALSGVGAVNMPQTPQIECFHLIYLSAALESDWASWPSGEFTLWKWPC